MEKNTDTNPRMKTVRDTLPLGGEGDPGNQGGAVLHGNKLQGS